jgi:hypothetical protein
MKTFAQRMTVFVAVAITLSLGWMMPVAAAPAANGFALVASSSSVTLLPGESQGVTIRVQKGKLFTGSIDIALSSNIAGLVVSKKVVAAGIQVAISAPAGLAAQSGEVVVLGTSGRTSSSVRIAVTVRAATPTFDLVRDGAVPLVLEQGGTVKFTVTVIPRNGYTGTPVFGPRSAGPHVLWKGAVRTAPNTFEVTIGATLDIPTGARDWTMLVSSGSPTTGDRIDKEFPLSLFVPNRTGAQLQLLGPVSIAKGAVATITVYVTPENPANNVSGQLQIFNDWNSQVPIQTISVPSSGVLELIDVPANDVNTGYGSGPMKLSARLTMPSGISVTSRLQISLA